MLNDLSQVNWKGIAEVLCLAGRFNHRSRMAASKHGTVLMSFSSNHLLIMNRKFSIGNKSGEFVGQ